MSLNLLVQNFKDNSNSDTELLVAIHNWVREEIKFGFTADFESVCPKKTLENGVGHCNAQADLLCHLFTLAGFDARLAFVYINKEILRYSIPKLVYFFLPKKLFHAVTQVKLEGNWVSIDSYIFTKSQFSSQLNRLKQHRENFCFGLHHRSECRWDGKTDCFSQAQSADIDEFCKVYESLAQAIKSQSNTNRILGVHFSTLLKPLAAKNGIGRRAFQSYINQYLN
ncbi:transglutaminase-like domain-containing protein [Vibrio intestinalis]|uniref:transglutaminase-like domain-containing protein n=1 Tax=Vibrio intestinalis TaxID=2933291 RepID=UPI0021A69EF9|nr:transglutaminase-like domain-containing protein [Vibrio intestinalis]